jgi:hypothetical protein
VQHIEALPDLAAEVLAEQLGDVGLVVDGQDADVISPSPPLLRVGDAAGAP